MGHSQWIDHIFCSRMLSSSKGVAIVCWEVWILSGGERSYCFGSNLYEGRGSRERSGKRRACADSLLPYSNMRTLLVGCSSAMDDLGRTYVRRRSDLQEEDDWRNNPGGHDLEQKEMDQMMAHLIKRFVCRDVRGNDKL